jgi:hypothetical protein
VLRGQVLTSFELRGRECGSIVHAKSNQVCGFEKKTTNPHVGMIKRKEKAHKSVAIGEKKLTNIL